MRIVHADIHPLTYKAIHWFKSILRRVNLALTAFGGMCMTRIPNDESSFIDSKAGCYALSHCNKKLRISSMREIVRLLTNVAGPPIDSLYWQNIWL